MMETHCAGQNMVETHVTSNFTFDASLYSAEELQCLDRTVDLFCRIKNTDQAEMMATVMFAYDSLKDQNAKVTEADVFHNVLDWKKHWAGAKEAEIQHTIRNLSLLEWIHPEISFTLDEDF